MRVLVYFAGVNKTRESDSIANIIAGDLTLRDHFKTCSTLALPPSNNKRVEHQPIFDLIEEVFGHHSLGSELAVLKVHQYLSATVEASRFLSEISDDHSTLSLVSNFGLPRLETGIWLSEVSSRTDQAWLCQKLRQAATRLFEEKADVLLMLDSPTDKRKMVNRLVCSLIDNFGELPWAHESLSINAAKELEAAGEAACSLRSIHSNMVVF